MRLRHFLYSQTYMQLCRAYSKFVVRDRSADSIYRFLCSFHFFKIHGYWPDFVHPRSHSEHIWHKMLFNRDPQLALYADKLGVRDYVAEKVGSEILISLLWHGKNPRDIPFDSLPERYVIKTNHASHCNIIVTPESPLRQDHAIRQLSEWLSMDYCYDCSLGQEWCYGHIEPAIIVEEHIGWDNRVPLDYKFHCFNGQVEIIHVDFGRYVDHTRYMADRSFKPISAEFAIKRHFGEVPRPQNLDRMIEIAETLANDKDFISVDLYNVGDKIYFGELTNYPGGGCGVWRPRKYDFILGKKWKTQLMVSSTRSC